MAVPIEAPPSFIRCLIVGMRAEAAFPLEVKTRRPDVFYLGLTVAGYLSLALALWCFGRGIVPPAYCAVGLLEHPYAQDPQVLLFLVPGAVFGLLGILQLRLDRNCSSKVNHKLIGLSFRCNALAVAGMCGATALAGLDGSWGDTVRPLLGLASLGVFLVGIILTLTNITWSLVLRSRKRPA
ncbi:MAG TPA: hypothetical protein VOA78_11150 [Candidatus Dormibacteraeota bacterium]|nr:hypothetical protein [Candidatus Dormibacteraeota bacterium]